MSDQPETAKQWAQRVLSEHGPPPPAVLSKIRAIRDRAERRTAEGRDR